jgi:ABC-type multidrug transport system fused ATPase/permease subunit
MKLRLPSSWQVLIRHLLPQRVQVLLLTLLLLGSIGLRILNPQIMRVFIDSALAGKPMRELFAAAVAFLGIALLQQFASVGVTYLGETVAWTATNALRAELARHALDLDLRFHGDHPPGELIERIDGDVTELAAFFSQFVVTVVGNALLLVGILVALLLESPRAALAFTSFAVVSVLALFVVKGLAVPHEKARREAEARLFGFVEEQLAGTEDIRACGAVDYSLRELTRLQSAIWRANRRAQLRRWNIQTVMGALLVVGNILAVVGGYVLYRSGSVSIGTVYLLISYFGLLEEPIWAMSRQVEGLQTIGACVQRLADLEAVRPGIRDGEKREMSGEPLGLAFEGVSYSFNDRDPVLADVSFALGSGKVLGLLGRTGSGKTTLARLVFRLYDPTEGRILIDEDDLRRLKLHALRGRVALVTQDVQLFRATLRENLTFFDTSVADERILAALEDLALKDWFETLPDGLDTGIGSGGHSLSAGEAQLVAFARVFLREAGLVILDEASSRLDPATERRVERALDKLLHNRTAIVIAHRLRTVHRADEILILDEGRVREHGPRRALADDPASLFSHLLSTGLEEMLE